MEDGIYWNQRRKEMDKETNIRETEIEETELRQKEE
jgi:cbb3-type cytochrome oxidase subunit 3